MPKKWLWGLAVTLLCFFAYGTQPKAPPKEEPVLLDEDIEIINNIEFLENYDIIELVDELRDLHIILKAKPGEQPRKNPSHPTKERPPKAKS